MRISIIGCGAIGSALAEALVEMDDIEKIYVTDRKREKAAELLKKSSKIMFSPDPKKTIDQVDLVVEAASQEAVKNFIPTALEMGKDVIVMTVGTFADDEFRKKCEELAKENNCKIYLPSGAVCGVDGVCASSIGKVEEIVLITYKPPEALRDVKYLEDRKIDLDKLSRPTVVFNGHARDAIRYFPRNINVAATISLAGIGMEKTRVRIVVDPGAKMNAHRVIVKGQSGEIEVNCRNLPSPANPKTSYIAIFSAIATIKKILGNVWVGA